MIIKLLDHELDQNLATLFFPRGYCVRRKLAILSCFFPEVLYQKGKLATLSYCVSRGVPWENLQHFLFSFQRCCVRGKLATLIFFPEVLYQKRNFATSSFSFQSCCVRRGENSPRRQRHTHTHNLKVSYGEFTFIYTLCSVTILFLLYTFFSSSILCSVISFSSFFFLFVISFYPPRSS